MTSSLITEKVEDFAGLQFNVKQLKVGDTVFGEADLASAGGLNPVFTNVDAGASGTAGTVDIFPAGASKGKTQFTATNNTGNTTTTVTNAAQAAARVYTIPDAGADASFVMTKGAQTIVDAMTFSVKPVLAAAGLTANATDVSSTELATLAAATSANAGTGKVAILGTSGAITHAGAVTMSAAATVGTTLGVTGVTTPTGGVAAAGGFAFDPKLCATGDAPAMASADGNDSTPVITEVYYAQVFVPANCTVTGVAVFNGSVASGNLKVGLANSSGVNVATSASTAMSGTDAYQRVPFTGTYAAVGPATYYVELFIDNTTARYNTWPLGSFVSNKQTGQTYATGFTTITPGTTFVANLGPMASLY